MPAYISAPEAVKLAASLGTPVTRPTIVRWAVEYRIGHQIGGPGGRWRIHPDRLITLLTDGEFT